MPISSQVDGQRPYVQLALEAVSSAKDVSRRIECARTLGRILPRPGQGETRLLWSAMATLGAHDLQLARTVEPHLDAIAILAEAGHRRGVGKDEEFWGVYAAESPGKRLEARRLRGDQWVLSGEKGWCSLAEHASHALVTAWVDERQRGLFAVALTDPGIAAAGGPEWVAHGLREVTSTGVSFDDVPATAVGDPGWYLRRDGFAWGGMGVAAVWYGGAVGVARRLLVTGGREPDQMADFHLGAVDSSLAGARAVLDQAAAAVDGGFASGASGQLLAQRVRCVVAKSAEHVLRTGDHALGPAPLVSEPEYADRVADLHLYLRQHHAERDVAALGHLAREASFREW